jgi:predicted amidohydrolase
MKVAVAKYPISQPGSFAEFARKQASLLDQAAAAGARVVVLPEYLSLELAAIFGPSVAADLPTSLAVIQQLHSQWLQLYSGLAKHHGLHLVAGSFLLEVSARRYRNRSYWFAPDGKHGWQDKLQLTGFEKNLGLIEPGDALKVFDLNGSRAGIAICYDSEFPLPVRAQYEAGARLLLVPSCTDSAAGAVRVRVGCQARALENRMFVAQSVTTGLAEWSPALDVNTGEATIYAPMDAGFPASGVLARTSGGQVWALADVDLAALEASRVDAQVANDRDWNEQFKLGIRHAQLERI